MLPHRPPRPARSRGNPSDDWQQLRRYYQQLKRREAVLRGIGEALREVPEIVAGRQPEVELEEFLDSL